jgi:hypothetical protein
VVVLAGLDGGGGAGVFNLNLSNVEGRTKFFESLHDVPFREGFSRILMSRIQDICCKKY